MATHDWMKGDYPANGAARRGARAESVKEKRSSLEVVLAAAGVAAWLWCGYEVLTALLR